MTWQLVLQLIVAIGGAAGVGGVVVKLGGHWLDHLLAKRKQTDDMALQIVGKYDERMGRLERDNERLRAEIKRERELCDFQLDGIKQQLASELTFSDTLVIAIRRNPEDALAIIADAEAMRELRRQEAERRARPLDRRNELQVAESAAALPVSG